LHFESFENKILLFIHETATTGNYNFLHNHVASKHNIMCSYIFLQCHLYMLQSNCQIFYSAHVIYVSLFSSIHLIYAFNHNFKKKKSHTGCSSSLKCHLLCHVGHDECPNVTQGREQIFLS